VIAGVCLFCVCVCGREVVHLCSCVHSALFARVHVGVCARILLVIIAPRDALKFCSRGVCASVVFVRVFVHVRVCRGGWELCVWPSVCVHVCVHVCVGVCVCVCVPVYVTYTTSKV